MQKEIEKEKRVRAGIKGCTRFFLKNMLPAYAGRLLHGIRFLISISGAVCRLGKIGVQLFIGEDFFFVSWQRGDQAGTVSGRADRHIQPAEFAVESPVIHGDIFFLFHKNHLASYQYQKVPERNFLNCSMEPGDYFYAYLQL